MYIIRDSAINEISIARGAVNKDKHDDGGDVESARSTRPRERNSWRRRRLCRRQRERRQKVGNLQQVKFNR